ncbi:MAG: histidine phosphatase family protein [Proteobacteria bacterium]|nr:histidine phosphatase family protein [Pseudomonadota bacterium]
MTTVPLPLYIYLIRHGETEWTLSGQYTGRTDIPLTTHGEDSARQLGLRLRDISFTHVLTSPFKRAQQTCEASVAIFSHGHFGRVLAARWIGLPVEKAQHLLMNTASLSILCYEHNRGDQPAIALWNSAVNKPFIQTRDDEPGAKNRGKE